jgi:hypothetical protein
VHVTAKQIKAFDFGVGQLVKEYLPAIIGGCAEPK